MDHLVYMLQPPVHVYRVVLLFDNPSFYDHLDHKTTYFGPKLRLCVPLNRYLRPPAI